MGWLSVSECTVIKINILQKRLLPKWRKEESKFKQTQLVFSVKNENLVSRNTFGDSLRNATRATQRDTFTKTTKRL